MEVDFKNQVMPALPSSVGLFNIRATYAGKYMQHWTCSQLFQFSI